MNIYSRTVKKTSNPEKPLLMSGASGANGLMVSISNYHVFMRLACWCGTIWGSFENYVTIEPNYSGQAYVAGSCLQYSGTVYSTRNTPL